MNSGPFISRQQVGAALNALIATTGTSSTNPLTALLLVDEFCLDPDLPATDHLREFALKQILIDHITTALNEQRHSFGLPRPDCKVQHEAALTALAADAQTGSAELIGWSLLFYRYVCVDLNLKPDDFRAALHVDERSVRRYQSNGVERLTERLIGAEWAARRRQRQRQLIAALPATARTVLYGRDAELAAADALLTAQPPYHLYVSGPGGSGKTVFVQEWLRRLIEAGQIDRLIWLDKPPSADAVRAHLTEHLLPERTQITLREVMAVQRVALVLDEPRYTGRSGDLDGLLRELDGMIVCMIHTGYWPPATPHRHITLNPLDDAAVAQLARFILPHPDSVEPLIPTIQAYSGGNPLAVRLLTRQLPFHGDVAAMQGDVVRQMYSDAYARLSESARRAAVAITMLPPGEFTAAAVQAIWGAFTQPSQLGELARLHLLERVSMERDTYQLLDTARRYIDAAAERAFTSQLLHYIDTQLDDGERVAALLPVIESIAAEPRDGSDSLRTKWLRRCWREGLRLGHHARWRVLLADVASYNAELMLAYAICERRLGQWDQADEWFDLAAQMLGRAGDFTLQARALVERAVLARYRGNYAAAGMWLSRAEHAALHHDDAELSLLWRLEQAQIAIDRQDAVAAVRYLDGLGDHDRVTALYAEAALLAGAVDRAQGLVAQLSERTSQLDRVVEARLRTLIGRGYEQHGDFEAAYEQFSAALAHLERGHDSFGLARAQCNLGAVALRLGHADEAVTLLAHAERTQTALGDQVALAATRHNLQLARIHLSR